MFHAAQEASSSKTPVKAMPERVNSVGVLDEPTGPPKEQKWMPPPPPLHLFSAREKGSMDAVALQRYNRVWAQTEQCLAKLWRMETEYNYQEAHRVAKAMPTSRRASL